MCRVASTPSGRGITLAAQSCSGWLAASDSASEVARGRESRSVRPTPGHLNPARRHAEYLWRSVPWLAVERGAVRVERRTEHGLLARSARPGGVAAAVSAARLMTNEDLAGTEGVSAWAVLWCPHHPCPSGGTKAGRPQA